MSLGFLLCDDKLILALSFIPFRSGSYLTFLPHYFISPVVSLGENFTVLMFI